MTFLYTGDSFFSFGLTHCLSSLSSIHFHICKSVLYIIYCVIKLLRKNIVLQGFDFFLSIGSPAMKKVERFSVKRINSDGRCLFRALVLFNIYFLIVKIISTISYGNLFLFQSRCWLFKLVFESSLRAAIKALHELLCPWASPSSEQPSSSHLPKVSSQSVVGATTSYETTSFSSVVEVPNLLYLLSSSYKIFFFFLLIVTKVLNLIFDVWFVHGLGYIPWDLGHWNQETFSLFLWTR